MARQARRAANLVPGASLRGLVFDACADNCIPNTFGMLRHFGMPNRNRVLVSESPHLDTAGLATALRIDEAEVLSRTYPAHGRGHRVFHGLHVMKGRIEDRVRRFSPSAIAAGVTHHPATHELRDIPFSTVGWDVLQDTCPCEDHGVRQNWVTSNGTSRCHSCGGDLGKLPAVLVPDELRPALGFIAGLVDPDPAAQRTALTMLPAQIRGAERTLLYDMVMNLTRATSTDAQNAHPTARMEALARACSALTSWPAGLDDVARSADCPRNIWEWVRRTYSILDRPGQAAATKPTAARSASPPAPRPTYAPSGSKGRLRTETIGAMAAARLGGVDEVALKQAWDDGRFTQHLWMRGARRVRAFDPAEVVVVAPRLRVGGTRAMAASHLGLPIYGLEQLLEQELVTPALPGSGVKQSEAHVEAARVLVARLANGASVLPGPTVPLLQAIRHVSGRPKPWAALITALLDGAIPFDLVAGLKTTGALGRIIVPWEAIPDIVAMPHEIEPKTTIERATRWVGTDALECMNGNASASQMLDKIEFTGNAKKKNLPVPLILERAAAGVTTSDLTRRSGNGSRHIVAVLRQEGIKQIAPGLWERHWAERLILPATLRVESST